MSNEPDKSEIPWGKKQDYTEDEARAFWVEAWARVERNECDFRGKFFPEDPGKQGFHGIKFQVDANFRKAEFAGVAIFIHAKFGGDANFREAKFGGDVAFWSAEFGGDANFWDAEFGGRANFINTEFGGVANFLLAKFGGYAEFWYAKFGGDAIFREAKFDVGAMFAGAEFDGVAEFCEAKFGGKAKFIEAKFGGYADFMTAKFDGDANFDGAEFGADASFPGAKFGGDASFPGAKFGGDAYFQRAKFGGDANFDRVKFVGDADFEECRFSRNASMNTAICRGTFSIDLSTGWRRLTRQSFSKLGQGYDAYRMAKQSAANRGDYWLAGKYHFAEQSTRSMEKLVSSWQPLCSFRKAMLIVWRRKLLLLLRKATWVALADKLRRKPTWVAVGKKLQRFFPWAWMGFRNKLPGVFRIATWVAVGKKLKDLGKFLKEFTKLIFSNWLFGYGERPQRIISTALLAIFGWAWLYYPAGIESTPAAEASFLDCLYFSIVTFTTLGYGDLHPATDMRFWAGTEALAGAFLMALFVVAMARKFTR